MPPIAGCPRLVDMPAMEDSAPKSLQHPFLLSQAVFVGHAKRLASAVGGLGLGFDGSGASLIREHRTKVAIFLTEALVVGGQGGLLLFGQANLAGLLGGREAVEEVAAGLDVESHLLAPF